MFESLSGVFWEETKRKRLFQRTELVGMKALDWYTV